MKVSELQEMVKNGEDIDSTKLEIKTFMPIIEKKLFMQDVLEDCMDIGEDGMLRVDFANRKIATNIGMMLRLSNLEFDDPKEFMDQYNFLDEHEIFTMIKDEALDTYWEIIDLISDEIEQRKELENGISGVLNRGLIKFTQIVDANTSPKNIQKLVKALSREFKGFDPEKMGFLKDALKFNNATK